MYYCSACSSSGSSEATTWPYYCSRRNKLPVVLWAAIICIQQGPGNFRDFPGGKGTHASSPGPALSDLVVRNVTTHRLRVNMGLSRLHASGSMPKNSTTTAPASNFKVIFEKALEAYERKTKQDLINHPLASQLQACDSPAAILTILQDQVHHFEQSRSGDERLRRWIDPTINVL
ncbi:hypothetical protein EDB86DRAFT_1601869 [Lactarius hatsudake]|nr:hypothetical protein EDB86DRAFT_1601869 [Lactarius hatsudake]